MADKIRLTVDLSFEQGVRLRKNVDWGDQGHLFRKIVDQLNDFVETYGKIGVAALIAGELDLLDLMKRNWAKGEEPRHEPKGPKTKHPRTLRGGGSKTDPQHQGE